MRQLPQRQPLHIVTVIDRVPAEARRRSGARELDLAAVLREQDRGRLREAELRGRW